MWLTIGIIGFSIALLGYCVIRSGDQADDAHRRSRLYEQARNLFPNLDAVAQMEALRTRTIRNIRAEQKKGNLDTTEMEEDLIMLNCEIVRLTDEQIEAESGYEARSFVGTSK